jgi:hypothetical protein
MLPLSALSRRAVVAAGLLAAPAAAAKKKRKKRRKKPPPPPLAFAVARVTNVNAVSSPSGSHFSLAWDLALLYPAEAFDFDSNGPLVQVAAAATEQQMRAALVAEVRRSSASVLDNAGFAVPADRIAVALT